MTRGDARELAVHLIYSREFTGDAPLELVKNRLDEKYYSNLAEENEIYLDRPSARQVAYIDEVVAGVAQHAEELDAIIGRYSIGWNVSRISRLSRAILQLAIYEISYLDDVPNGVAVSEAVRLVKKYDLDAAGFVNGILGSVVRAIDTPAPIEALAEDQEPAPEEAAQTPEQDAAEEVTEEI